MGIDASVGILRSDLSKASAGVRQMAQLAIEKAAFDIEGLSKVRAPVDTGALRSSIGTRVGELEALVGPTVDYAFYVEFGTSRTPGGQPFLNPAVDEVEPKFYAAIESISGRFL